MPCFVLSLFNNVNDTTPTQIIQCQHGPVIKDKLDQQCFKIRI